MTDFILYGNAGSERFEVTLERKIYGLVPYIKIIDDFGGVCDIPLEMVEQVINAMQEMQDD